MAALSETLPTKINNLTLTLRTRRVREPLLLVVALVLATLVMTYPVAFTLGTRVPGWPGDTHEYLWKVWFVAQTVLVEGRWPVVAPEVFYPFGLNLAGTEMTFATTLLGAPLTIAFGTATSYSLLSLASFVLTGLGVALIVHNLSGSWLAGMVGGLAFAFSDYRMERLGGHLNLMQTQWVVFAFYFTERWLRDRRHWQAAMAGLMVTLSALATWQYALALAVLLPPYVLWRVWPFSSLLRDRRTYVSLAWGLAALLPVMPFLLSFLAASSAGMTAHPFHEIDRYSAQPQDFLVPRAHHPFAGLIATFIPQLERDSSERTLYLGAVALALAITGFVAYRRHRAAQAFAVVGLIAALLALGPTLQGPSGRVYVDVPGPVTAAATAIGIDRVVESRLSPDLAADLREGRFFVPTPATLLVMTGFVDGFRAWGRLGGFTAFAVGVLAGLGAAHLTRLATRRALLRGGARYLPVGAALGLVLGGLVLLDQARVPFPTFALEPRPVDLWLARQPGDFAVMHFPDEAAYSGISMYGQTIHRKPMTYGYATFPPVAYRELHATLKRFPDEDVLALLRGWGVRYILVTPESYGEQWEAVRQRIDDSRELVFVTQQGDTLVYELLPRR